MLIAMATDADSARGQVIAGRVVDAAAGQPLPGAVVRVEGSRASPTMAGADGRFVLRLAEGGAFAVRVEMLGHEVWRSGALSLQAADTVWLDVALSVQAIPLAQLIARSTSRCASRDHDAAVYMDRLWRNVATALEAERITRREPFEYSVDLYERDVTLDSLVVVRDQRARRTGRALIAFGHAPIAYLDEHGFFEPSDQGGSLFGPTADILLDSWFTNTHCLRTRQQAPDSDFVVVEFAPNSDRKVTEIEGTVWLDRRTLDLTRIEFTYVNLPRALPVGAHSGTIHFTRLANGALILSSWTLRSPLIEMISRSTGRHAGTHEVGGQVVAVEASQQVVFNAAQGSIEGTIRDADGEPLAGADVYLVGTGFEARSDVEGRYRLTDVPAGTYRLSFDHASLDPRRAQPRRAIVVPGAATLIHLQR